MRIMKTLTTAEGRARYDNDLYWNIDDLTMVSSAQVPKINADRFELTGFPPHLLT
jgi:hypothetical protein